MPLAIKWSKFTYQNLDRVDWIYGVYELGDRYKEIIYIGQGILRDRLLAHLRSEDPCFKKARYFRVEKTGGKFRAKQRERTELNKYADNHDDYLPECNRRMEFL